MNSDDFPSGPARPDVHLSMQRNIETTDTLNSLLAKGLMTELDYMSAEEAAEAIELEARLMAEAKETE